MKSHGSNVFLRSLRTGRSSSTRCQQIPTKQTKTFPSTNMFVRPPERLQRLHEGFEFSEKEESKQKIQLPLFDFSHRRRSERGRLTLRRSSHICTKKGKETRNIFSPPKHSFNYQCKWGRQTWWTASDLETGWCFYPFGLCKIKWRGVRALTPQSQTVTRVEMFGFLPTRQGNYGGPAKWRSTSAKIK